jgi:toxin-antitoxin system PIN domain toxin
MTYLVDVNVWLAMATTGHVHHQAALEWYEGTSRDQLLFCRVTQMGFLRLVTNPRVMQTSVVTAARAWEILGLMLQDGRIRYATEPLRTWEQWRVLTNAAGTGPNFWTDAYLAAFAVAGGYTVVSFDRGFSRFKSAPVKLLG